MVCNAPVWTSWSLAVDIEVDLLVKENHLEEHVRNEFCDLSFVVLADLGPGWVTVCDPDGNAIV